MQKTSRKFVEPASNPFSRQYHETVRKKLNSLLNAQIMDEDGNTIGTVLYADGNVILKLQSSSGTAEVAAFAIKELTHPDFFTAQKISGLTTNALTSQTFGTFAASPIVKIAKPANIRRSITSDVFDGTTVTYTGGDADNNRIANIDAQTESQCLYPRYVASADAGGGLQGDGTVLMTGQSVIYAVKMDGGAGVYDFSGATPERIDWMEISPARVWAKRFT